MKRRSFLRLGTGAAAGGLLAACGGKGDDAHDGPVSAPLVPTAPDKTVQGWTRTALQAIQAARPGPPMAARSLSVMYTCMYNTWCAYDATAVPTSPGQPARRPAIEHNMANKAAALSHAAYTALVDQFPTQKAVFDGYLKQLGYDPVQAPADPGLPAGLGTTVARAEIEFCHADGANQLGDLTPSGVPYADYTGYAPVNPPLVLALPTPREAIPDPSRWQPLTYADASGAVRTPIYLGAAWDRVRPFALASGSQYRPGPPARFGTAEYEEQARRIVDVQAALTDEQKAIAEYWNDGPGTDLPPGHWLRFALYVATRDGHTDEDDVRMFFALGAALGDAAIAAWDAKRTYDSERPITAVRYIMNGKTMLGYGPLGPLGGLRPIQGESWVPYQAITFPTPPFPEHVSGHSTFSAAAAEVLRQFTGSDAFGARFTVAAHSMKIEAGMPSSDVALSWATFSVAAEQAGLSRIYGGIHFDKANAAGQALGRKVGASAFARAQQLWQGRT
jgi:hypothetical protein